tara:strand:+ start:1473 stop:2612 length:1140 start_codon:yes stop_codon:yes gene_type:complete
MLQNVSMKRTKVLGFIFLSLIVFACSTSDNGGGTSEVEDNFNRSAMLVNWADNIIIPAHNAFNIEVAAMVQASTVFTESPSEVNLQSLRSAWKNAYLAFQSVSMFEIGKAEELNFRNRLNVYPTDVQKIEENVASNTYNFSLPSNIAIQGFPAIDYMINGLAETDAEIVAYYNSDATTGYNGYLNKLTTTILELSTTVLNDWEGSYRNSFVAATSSSATGSVDKLVNDFLFYYEKSLRAGKIGIPAGVFSADPLPEKVEAYYSKEIGKDLLLAAITASKDFFNGKSFTSTTEGESLKSYLDFLNTIKNGDDLSALINNQFNVSKSKAEELLNDLALQVTTDNSKMTATYDELQRNVILLKVDMLQALSINVDFVDADGD